MSSNFNQDLIEFIQASPTPFHAATLMKQQLEAVGFIAIEESDAWDMQIGQRYVVTRNDSSIIAFVYGKEDLLTHGLRMIGAHTDSPCLKLKPNANLYRKGYWQLGVEVYGGALLNPWFDRELSLAGRVSLQDESDKLHHLLIDFVTPVGMVPSLAIHLDREANKKRSINAQKDLPVLLSVGNTEDISLHDVLLKQLNKQYPNINIKTLLDYELSFYDAQPGSVYGINQDFIAASRLDNLLSCYIAMQSIIAADGKQSCLLVCNDHEEVGSATASGAQGSMLSNFLQRLLPESEQVSRVINQSMLISVDNAHAIHPNFTEKHDENHGPVINDGPVIKINASQRYASNSETQAIFRALCLDKGIPLQAFVVRSDMACGSTIGSITAAEIGVKTLDVGLPTLAMHSIRETAGSRDALYMLQALTAFSQLSKF